VSNLIPSPCIGRCDYDPALGHCLGCGRNLRDIGAWPEASGPERIAIRVRAAARLAGHLDDEAASLLARRDRARGDYQALAPRRDDPAA